MSSCRISTGIFFFSDQGGGDKANQWVYQESCLVPRPLIIAHGLCVSYHLAWESFYLHGQTGRFTVWANGTQNSRLLFVKISSTSQITAAKAWNWNQRWLKWKTSVWNITSGKITGSPSSKYEHRRASALLRNIQNIRICMGKKPIVSVTYENERISIKNSLPYLKCVLRLSCVVQAAGLWPFYGFLCKRFSL